MPEPSNCSTGVARSNGMGNGVAPNDMMQNNLVTAADGTRHQMNPMNGSSTMFAPNGSNNGKIFPSGFDMNIMMNHPSANAGTPFAQYPHFYTQPRFQAGMMHPNGTMGMGFPGRQGTYPMAPQQQQQPHLGPPQFSFSNVQSQTPTNYYVPPEPPRPTMAYAQSQKDDAILDQSAAASTSGNSNMEQKDTPTIRAVAKSKQSSKRPPNPKATETSKMDDDTSSSSDEPPQMSDTQEHQQKQKQQQQQHEKPVFKESYLEEVTEVRFPPGFFVTKDDETEVDYAAKLAKTFQEAGGDEKSGIYKTWTSPDCSSSLWDSIQSIFDERKLAQSSQLRSHSNRGRVTRRSRRNSSKSYVKEVYADTRYVGVSLHTGRLMMQDEKVRQRYEALDVAISRDYRLLPVDYFVSKMDVRGLDDNDDKSDSSDQDSPCSTRTRRRRRRGTYKEDEGDDDEPAKRQPKRAKPPQITPTSSRVGENYQAQILPSGTDDDTSYIPHCEQLWDHNRAEAAIERGENIDGFLSLSGDLNARMLLMEALHRSNYSVEKANEEYIKLHRETKEPTGEMQINEILNVNALFEEHKKNFSLISKLTGRSVSTVLMQYYRWKTTERNGAYTIVKGNKWADTDWCCVCEDGGNLIVCDNCHKGYHFDCHQPKLSKLPDTEVWFCHTCMRSPAKLRRIPGIMEDSNQPPPPKRALAFSPSEKAGADGEKKDDTSLADGKTSNNLDAGYFPSKYGTSRTEAKNSEN